MTAKQMTTQEIVKKQCERDGDDFEQVYTALHQQIEAGNVRIMRSGDTLLGYHLTNPHEADLFLITSEPQPKIVEAIKQFYQAMTKAGFVRATAELKTQGIAPMLRKAGVPFAPAEGNNIVIGG